MAQKLIIPAKDSILQTSEEDMKHYYYSWFWPVRYMYRKRLSLCLDAIEKKMKGKKFDSLLELGTGGGFLLYSLSRMAKKIIASDIHPNLKGVEKNLRKDGLTNITFIKFDINRIPYTNEHFDGVVAMSILEHLHTLPKAVSEIKRVLKKNGTAIVGIPADNWIMKIGFILIGAGEEVKHHHCNTHKDIIRELKRQFAVKRIKQFPVPCLFPMYYMITCEKKD